ncbi:MAG TPA: hypothetical protein VK425_11155, partial [Acidimicrobiales bacterium]|nr:hypothetical protein [Acidimicrobiales bacterium]
MTRASLMRPWLPRRVAAFLAAGLSVGTVATVAVAVPITSSSAQSASAPTASITVEVQDQGSLLDKYLTDEATAFNKANPGDNVTMDIVPTNNVYKQKLL